LIKVGDSSSKSYSGRFVLLRRLYLAEFPLRMLWKRVLRGALLRSARNVNPTPKNAPKTREFKSSKEHLKEQILVKGLLLGGITNFDETLRRQSFCAGGRLSAFLRIDNKWGRFSHLHSPSWVFRLRKHPADAKIELKPIRGVYLGSKPILSLPDSWFFYEVLFWGDLPFECVFCWLLLILKGEAFKTLR